MNNDTIAGKFDQAKGKVKQAVGEAFNDQSLANSGAADEVKGAARETWGKTKDAASNATQSKRTTAEADAHDLRVKVTHSAENVKDSIANKFDNAKGRHNR